MKKKKQASKKRVKVKKLTEKQLRSITGADGCPEPGMGGVSHCLPHTLWCGPDASRQCPNGNYETLVIVLNQG